MRAWLFSFWKFKIMHFLNQTTSITTPPWTIENTGLWLRLWSLEVGSRLKVGSFGPVTRAGSSAKRRRQRAAFTGAAPTRGGLTVPTASRLPGFSSAHAKLVLKALRTRPARTAVRRRGVLCHLRKCPGVRTPHAGEPAQRRCCLVLPELSSNRSTGHFPLTSKNPR